MSRGASRRPRPGRRAPGLRPRGTRRRARSPVRSRLLDVFERALGEGARSGGATRSRCRRTRRARRCRRSRGRRRGCRRGSRTDRGPRRGRRVRSRCADEIARELVELGDAALLELESVRPQLWVGDALGQRAGADHDDRVRALGGQRVERGDAQTDQVRRRLEVRFVHHPARRVVAHRALPADRAERSAARSRAAVSSARRRSRCAAGGEALRGDGERRTG